MSDDKAPDPQHSRRAFLGAALASAGVAGLASAAGIRLIELAGAQPGARAGLRPSGEAASPKTRWGMLIDTARCTTGCTACVDACATENAIKPGTGRPEQSSQWLRKIELKEARTGREVSLPMMCQHCASPPCVDVCPTGASFKRADGIVLVDSHICIGCRYCMMACPYKARSFVHEPLDEQNPLVPRGKGCVEGCTLCVQRLDRGVEPACVEACQKAGHGAMAFGDLNDATSDIAKRIATVASTQVRADLRLDPAMRYRGI